MKKINIFVNNKNLIEISQFSSVYSLKGEIQKIPEFSTALENIRLDFQGKSLVDNKSLFSYKIENNSHINAYCNLSGGNTGIFILEILYYLSIPLYLLFLLSGLVPFVANCFGYIFNNIAHPILDGLSDWLTSLFGKEKQIIFIIKIIKGFLNVVIWLIKHFSLILFIWATAAYIIFPGLYNSYNDYCKAGLEAKTSGFWVMFFYMLAYFALNIVDFFIDILDFFVSDHKESKILSKIELPEIVKAIVEPSLQIYKQNWDIVKFSPFYAIPFVGEAYMAAHEGLEIVMSMVYGAMDTISQFNCEDKSTAEGMYSILTALDNRLNSLKGKKKSDVSEPEVHGLNDFQSKMASAALIEPIKNYKLGRFIKFLRQGFYDMTIKNSGKPLPKLEGTEWEMGGLNRWSSGVTVSVFCDFLEAMNDMTTVLWGVGLESEVVNMIKTGNIAGIFGVIAFIYNYFF